MALAKLPKSQRPRGWYKDHISISLGTADRATAKATCPDVAAEVAKTMAALLAGPAPLTHEQINSLSGELYNAFARGLEKNPVLTPQQWMRVAAMNEEARQGRYGTVAALGIHRTAEDRRRASMEARFGKMTDTYLTRRGVITDMESRWSLIERASEDLSKAAEKLARNAGFDYEADPWAKRFTPFEASASDAENTSLTALAEEWHTDALARGVRKRDAKRIKSSFERLIKFLEHDDVRRVTQQDILRWRANRYAMGRSRKTIDDSDIASFKNVFNFAVDLKRIAVNPTDGTAEKGRKNKGRKVVREEFFTENEARDILLHAAAVTGSPKEKPKTTAAKRWVPWLCAYSGARVAEMIQLRKQDIRHDREYGWVIRLTPEAGSIKNDTFCDVPVHEHLEAQGFIDFVRSAGVGHLFVTPAADGTIDGPASGVYKRIRDMVREVVKDTNVAPNHAWRYTFKTIGTDAEIAERVLDAITNHAPGTRGAQYAKVMLKTRATAMSKFPRYRLDTAQAE